MRGEVSLEWLYFISMLLLNPCIVCFQNQKHNNTLSSLCLQVMSWIIIKPGCEKWLLWVTARCAHIPAYRLLTDLGKWWSFTLWYCCWFNSFACGSISVVKTQKPWPTPRHFHWLPRYREKIYIWLFCSLNQIVLQWKIKTQIPWTDTLCLSSNTIAIWFISALVTTSLFTEMRNNWGSLFVTHGERPPTSSKCIQCVVSNTNIASTFYFSENKVSIQLRESVLVWV